MKCETMLLYVAPVFLACYAADSGEGGLDPYIPHIWAQESLEILKENMGVTNLVHRDFQNEVASYGDLVHTRRPGEFKVVRRTDQTPSANLPQIASATDVQVPLDQWFNATFTIPEGAMSKSFKELVSIFLEPAVLEIARGVDRAVLGRVHAFLGTPMSRAGRLNAIDASNVYNVCVEADKVLNTQKAPAEGRSLLLSASAKATMLQCDKFVKAMERGDGGATLRTAILGNILGFDTYMFQNVNHVLTGTDMESDTVTDAHAAGSLDTQTTAASLVAGEYAVVSGNDQPTWIATAGTGTNAGKFTMNEPNKYATSAGAVLTVYKACAAAASYDAKWGEGIVVGGYAAGCAPQVGQLLAFGSTAATRRTYTVIESTDSGSTCVVVLDRPLEIAVTASDPAFPGPVGSICPAIHKNALALVTRPLATTHAAGIEFGVQEDYGIGIRVAMQHKINEGLVVAVDLLAGVAVLNNQLCVPVLM